MRSYAVLPLAIVALGCGRGAEGHCNLELPGWVCAPATGGGSVVLQPCLQGDGGNPPEPLASPVQDGRCTVTGVIDTTVGYAGGSAATATYAQVTTETTGHAESVRVVYDPSKITYGTLLRIFFSVAHDPTELNYQGPDVGTSYRSVIFYLNDDQQRIANAYIAQLDAAKVFKHRIVTQVTPLKGFYRAEEYHQDYALHNPDNPYILVCDRPKISELRKQFPDLFVDYTGKH